MIELSPHLITIVIVLVLILMWVLNLMLYRPMLKGLDERKSIVEGAAQDAANAEQKIQSLQQEYDHALQDARRDAKAVFNKNQEEALSKEKEILSEANKKTEKYTEKALNGLYQSSDTARDQLKSHVETLSREISSKVLGRAF